MKAIGIVVASLMCVVLLASVVVAEDMPQRPQRPMLAPFGPQILGPERVKAEMERHRGAMGDIHKQVRAMHEAVREAVEGGAKPEEAVAAQRPKSVELAKAIIAELGTHFQNLADMAENVPDEEVEKLANHLLHPPRPQRPQMEGVQRHHPMPPPDENAPEGEPEHMPEGY